MGTAIKHPVPDWVKPSSVIFDIWALWHRVSKIRNEWQIDWLSSVSRPRQHSIGYMGDGFLQVKRPNQQYQSTEGTYSTQRNQTYNNQTINTKHSKSPCLHWCGVTKGWLPQRAGLLGLNGSGAAASVPTEWQLNPVWHRMLYSCSHMATVGVKGFSEYI